MIPRELINVFRYISFDWRRLIILWEDDIPRFRFDMLLELGERMYQGVAECVFAEARK